MSSATLFPAALRALTTDAWLLFVTRFTRLFAYGSLSVILVFYLVSLGLSESETGLLLTLTLAGDIVVSLYLTTRADRIGRRRMLIAGAVLMALGDEQAAGFTAADFALLRGFGDRLRDWRSTFVDALAATGRREEARALFQGLLECRNRHGLLAEHVDPSTRELWGNFPQTYSMVGLINSATRLSLPWDQAF